VKFILETSLPTLFCKNNEIPINYSNITQTTYLEKGRDVSQTKLNG
jgi:hypothetical protein